MFSAPAYSNRLGLPLGGGQAGQQKSMLLVWYTHAAQGLSAGEMLL